MPGGASACRTVIVHPIDPRRQGAGLLDWTQAPDARGAPIPPGAPADPMLGTAWAARPAPLLTARRMAGVDNGESVAVVVDPRVPNPAASSVLAAIGMLAPRLDAILETLERQEQRSPGLFRITPAGSDMGDGIGAQSTRLRVTHWVIAVSAAGQFGVRVGSSSVALVEFAGRDTAVIPLPITIDSGKDISTVGAAADITDSFLLAFTE